MAHKDCKFLLHGIDTLQCAYYLAPTENAVLDFSRLEMLKDRIRESKKKEPEPLDLGHSCFMLQPYGSRSGYPFIIVNEDFRIEFGQYNNPNFYVTFRSQALWRESAFLLHKKFLKWVSSIGYSPYRSEAVSRVDFSFDYFLESVDFDESSFLSRSTKDSKYRESGKAQTFSFGKSDIVLRIYDKIAEIKQQSSKVWFYILWNEDKNVWRIEWQVRKPVLKSFGIYTFDELQQRQGDLLRYLSEEHDTLRKPNGDANPSRWPLHPLWKDLQKQIGDLNTIGVSRVYGKNSALYEREMRIGIAVLGYLKRFAAIDCVKHGKEHMNVWDAMRKMHYLLLRVNDPLAWEIDVPKKIKEIELGQW